MSSQGLKIYIITQISSLSDSLKTKEFTTEVTAKRRQGKTRDKTSLGSRRDRKAKEVEKFCYINIVGFSSLHSWK